MRLPIPQVRTYFDDTPPVTKGSCLVNSVKCLETMINDTHTELANMSYVSKLAHDARIELMENLEDNAPEVFTLVCQEIVKEEQRIADAHKQLIIDSKELTNNRVWLRELEQKYDIITKYLEVKTPT